jgi:N-carbamoylputrescine amidase
LATLRSAEGRAQSGRAASGSLTLPRLRRVREPKLITALGDPPPSFARVEEPTRPPLRVGAVQHRWHPDPDEHRGALAASVALAAQQGATLVCLQELTLSPYFAITADGPGAAGAEPEPVPDGPTCTFAAQLAREHGIHVHASLYERADGDDGLGFNTAVVMAPDGTLAARTRKLHIPVTAGYYEDKYFRPGPPGDDAFPVVALGDAHFGFPTCWDQWFPELARAYSLAGAEVLVYPTAIGSEPDHPDFDTEPLWERVIIANGIANGTFMVAVNRIGTEPPLTFYGSSFISDPYGRKLVQGPRDEPAVLVADLDLDQRRDWLALFPFLTTRRPDAYGSLATPSAGAAASPRA